jgi:hypothetical protein
MGLAMVPLRRAAAAFPQLVREVAGSTGKDVRLVVIGEDVELDTGCSTRSPTPCATWSPTPSTTAASLPVSGSRPGSRRRRPSR